MSSPRRIYSIDIFRGSDHCFNDMLLYTRKLGPRLLPSSCQMACVHLPICIFFLFWLSHEICFRKWHYFPSKSFMNIFWRSFSIFIGRVNFECIPVYSSRLGIGLISESWACCNESRLPMG